MYDYIHNKKRNRLEAARAEKLVYVFSNLSFLKRAQDHDYEEQCWGWEEVDDVEEELQSPYSSLSVLPGTVIGT